MSHPLSALSPSKQNTRTSPSKTEQAKSRHLRPASVMGDATSLVPEIDTPTEEEFHDSFSNAPSSPHPSVGTHDGDTLRFRSPQKRQSPFKYVQNGYGLGGATSPPDSPRESTIRFNEGLTQVIDDMRRPPNAQEVVSQHNIQDEMMSKIYDSSDQTMPLTPKDETETMLGMDERTFQDESVGDLSTISAIPSDMTRFATLRNSPTKTPRLDAWSPSKQLRKSFVVNASGSTQRPLHLLSGSRHSNSSNEDDDATPRRPQSITNDSPTDLLNFTGQSHVLIPPPGSAPRSTRRSPSGRGAFPIRVNPSPTHRSQASVDRERSAGAQSPQRRESFFQPQSTPAGSRRNTHSLDLLDIDLEPMATPRSIPTVTPRELETLRSELQSRIAGLEATLSGKEAEVMALKRAITDAEVRVGKTSEDLRNERAEKQDIEQRRNELERRSREMEDVLREVKQNAFVEEREREKLRREKEEWERKVEEKEVKVLELNASLDTLRDRRLNATPSPQKPFDSNVPATPNGTIDVDMAVKNATENVARELHSLYKGKHERKVADLKVSYEKRWQKQVEQLRNELKASQDEVLKLQTEKDATMSGVIPSHNAKVEDLVKANDALTAEKEILNAKVAGLEEQIATVKIDTASLRQALEQERVEKGDLVAQVDLFLSMSAQQEEAGRTPLPDSPPRTEDGGNGTASPSKFGTSMNGANGASGGGSGRPRPMSMLKAPTAGKFSGIPPPGESRLKMPGAGRSAGLARGGIMENIARMGAGGRA